MRRERDRGEQGGFKYKARSEEDWTKRGEKSGGGLRDFYLIDGTPEFKPHDGANRIRILPPTWKSDVNAPHYGVDIWLHYRVGADNSQFLCNKAMVRVCEEYGFNTPEDVNCPVCDERDKAAAEGDDDYAYSLKPVRRVLTALVDRDDEKKGVQYWAMPQEKIDQAIVLSAAKNGINNLDSPDDGFDVLFDYTKPVKNTPGKYEAVEIARRSSDLGDKNQIEDWMDYIIKHSISSVMQYFSFEHIAKVFAGQRPPAKKDDDKEFSSSSSDQDTGKSSREDELNQLTWEDIQEMRLSKLEHIAIKDLKFTEDELDKLNDKELREDVCKELRLKESEKERKSSSRDSEDRGSSDDRLAGLRNKYQK